MITTDQAQKATIRELEEKIEYVNNEMIKVCFYKRKQKNVDKSKKKSIIMLYRM